MAITEWTVIFDVQNCGTLSPLKWNEKQMKVVNAALETKEKNIGGSASAAVTTNSRAPFAIKRNVPQNCKIVTVEAESAEEAILAVNKFYSYGGQSAATAVLENVATSGPRTTNLVGNGKWAAVTAANLTEVAVT